MKIPFPRGWRSSQTINNYAWHPGCSGGGAWSGANLAYPMPCAGRWTHADYETSAAAGGGKSWTFSLYVEAAHGLDVSISGASQTQGSSDAEISNFAGDAVCIKTSAAGGALETTLWRSALVFEPTTPGQQPFLFGAFVTGTTFASLADRDYTTEAAAYCVVPIPGTFKNLYAMSCDGAVGSDCSVTLRSGGISKALTCTIPNGLVDANDVTHSYHAAAGELVDFMIVTGGTNEQLTAGVVFEPDDPTLWWRPAARGRVSLSSVDRYNGIQNSHIHLTTTTWQTSDASVYFQDLWPQGCYPTGAYCHLATAPGAGESRRFDLMEDGLAVRAQFTISNAATSGSVAIAGYQPAAFVRLGWVNVPSASPAGSLCEISIYGNSLETTLTAISPNQGARKATLDVVLTGDNFTGATAVSFEGMGITVNSFTVDTDEQITANITISASATCEARDVRVTTPLNAATLTDGFTILPAPPIVSSLTPASGLQGAL